MSFSKQLRVEPGAVVDLSKHDPDATPDVKNKVAAQEELLANIHELDHLQYLHYATHGRPLLIVLQGMDTSGKDGTIRHVMRGFNPLGCTAVAFKAPSEEERNHHFLWRIDQRVPGWGEVAIFNRSHYEDVLVPRVHGQISREVWSVRFDQINAFERMLHENGTLILKFFLHISKEEQRQRLAKRLTDETRMWKLSPTDFSDRHLWPSFMEAYEDLLTHCSTTWAPWYIIPASHKWFRNLAVSRIIIEHLTALNMRFPKPSFDLSTVRL